MASLLCKRCYAPSLALEQNEADCFSRDSREPLKVCPMHFSIQRRLSPPIRVLSGYSGHIKKSYHCYSVSLQPLWFQSNENPNHFKYTLGSVSHLNSRGCCGAGLSQPRLQYPLCSCCPQVSFGGVQQEDEGQMSGFHPFPSPFSQPLASNPSRDLPVLGDLTHEKSKDGFPRLC